MSEHEVNKRLHEVEFELATIITMLVLGLIDLAISDLIGLIFVIMLVVSGLIIGFVKYLKKRQNGGGLHN